jgi:NAD(P)-dependent dehydrogenase (short-subunit alcohol dehydrogenase family)
MGELEGKVAVIVGAAPGGIGAATAHLLSTHGAAVVVGDLDAEGAAQVVAELPGVRGPGVSRRTDVSVESDVAALMATAIDTYGRIDILVNNAAPLGLQPVDFSVAELDVEVWDQTFAVIGRGTFLGCKHAIPHMIAGGGGSIVNTSSAASLAGTWSGHAYGAAKASVNNLTKSVATRYGKQGIRCNAIAPGLVLTTEEKMPLERRERVVRDFLTITQGTRVGGPDDIARTVLFLSVDAAEYITGQIISVDGGMFAEGPWSRFQAEMHGTEPRAVDNGARGGR